eukprot:m.228346 g.228346  ORF g.228346 m.228346 type:complete len:58 (-) comp26423_c2_seq5:60-233(-)
MVECRRREVVERRYSVDVETNIKYIGNPLKDKYTNLDAHMRRHTCLFLSRELRVRVC